MSHELTEKERDARLDALVQAAEAERPASHPEPEELLAFHLGSLAPEERERVEEHLAGCPGCVQVVLDFEAFPDLEPEAALSAEQRQALETQRRQLGELPRKETKAAGTEVPGEAGEAPGGEVIAGPWRARLRTAWAVAAVFFVATVGLSFWTTGLVAPSEEPRILPYAEGVATVPRGGEPGQEEERRRISLSGGPGFVFLGIKADPLGFSGFRIELLEAGPGGRRLWAKSDLHPNEDRVFALLLPERWQPPGRYRFDIYGLRVGEEELVGSLGVEFLGETEGPTEIR